jgi:predicted hydrocarbon binding protein
MNIVSHGNNNKRKKEIIEREVKRMIKIPGNTRAVVLKANADYIRFKEGKKGLEKVEKIMREIGIPVDFNKINIFGWIKDGLAISVGYVAKEIFGWTEEDIFEMGKLTARQSLIAKLFLRYFLSPEKAFRKVNQLWNKYYDFGSIEAKEFNQKEQYAIIRIKRPKFHPLVCVYYRGYITQLCEFIFGKKEIKVEERKCEFKGDPYHEYIIRWR